MRRAVIDTNVLFEGLSGRGACGAIVEAWVARRFVPCVSTALALEYQEILTNRFGEARRPTVLKALQALLDRVEWIAIVHRIRPFSPDPDDDFLVECAFAADAMIVTRNLRDLKLAEEALRIPVLTPEDFASRLEE